MDVRWSVCTSLAWSPPVAFKMLATAVAAACTSTSDRQVTELEDAGRWIQAQVQW